METSCSRRPRHTEQTIFGLVRGFYGEDPLVREIHAPFAVLYLLWERR